MRKASRADAGGFLLSSGTSVHPTILLHSLDGDDILRGNASRHHDLRAGRIFEHPSRSDRGRARNVRLVVASEVHRLPVRHAEVHRDQTLVVTASQFAEPLERRPEVSDDRHGVDGAREHKVGRRSRRDGGLRPLQPTLCNGPFGGRSRQMY